MALLGEGPRFNPQHLSFLKKERSSCRQHGRNPGLVLSVTEDDNDLNRPMISFNRKLLQIFMSETS